MSLPESFALKSKYNNKYLRYIHEDSELHGFLAFSGDELRTPYTKFQAEMAKTSDGFVNIRSNYNNKYWVSHLENDEYWIVAKADEPNEDQSSWSCTLFQPFSVADDPDAIRLRHVQLKKYVCLSKASPPYTFCSFAGLVDPHPDSLDVFTVTNIESSSFLHHVTFKGDNDKYLSIEVIEKIPFLKFSAKDTTDLKTGFEFVLTNNDGNTHIKSISNNEFWRFNHKWIQVDSTPSDPDALFHHFIDRKTVVLRVRNLYCERYSRKDNSEKMDCLIANTSTFTEQAKLQMEERISSRLINNFAFNLCEARFHNKMNLEVASETRINDSDEELTIEFNLQYLHPVTKTWGSTIFKRIFDRFDISAKVPLPLKEKIEIVDEFQQDYIWGEPITTTTEESFHYSTIVPPKNKVNVKLIATKGTVDLPFTYTQHDTLVDGQLISFNFDDGLYTVTKFLEFNCEIEFKPLGA